MPPGMHARPIIVLGSGRSGTSLIAELVQRSAAASPNHACFRIYEQRALALVAGMGCGGRGNEG